jgi:hypothetical protein
VLNTADLASGVWKARVEWTAGGARYVMEQNLYLE